VVVGVVASWTRADAGIETPGSFTLIVFAAVAAAGWTAASVETAHAAAAYTRIRARARGSLI
jgi:hypothetical protein